MATRRLRTSKGVEVETPLSDEQAAALLAPLAATSDFARDLRRAWEGRYGWSPSQCAWAHKLVLDRLGAASVAPQRAPEALSDQDLGAVFGIEMDTDVKPEPKPVPLAPVPTPYVGIVALLKTASANLKHPKLRGVTEDGRPLTLSLAGSQSRYPGSVAVVGKGSFEHRPYYGRIMASGEWRPSRTDDQIAAALDAICQDPAEAARLYGKRVGHCSFCGLELTDARSRFVGYGPICAEKWGMPWGDRGDEPAVTEVAIGSMGT